MLPRKRMDKRPAAGKMQERIVKMIGKLKRELTKEKGAVQIMEASIVFPIMFIILFFLIYMGNAFYEKTQIEYVVNHYAIEGAAYCADPILSAIKANGAVPSVSNLESEPYRYLFGVGDVPSDIARKVKETINGKAFSFFSNMSPTVTARANFNNKIIYSTFSVEADYQIRFPISFLGRSTPPVVDGSVRAEIPVCDTPELIRNTDMVIDFMQQFEFGRKFAEGVSNLFSKINGFIREFAGQ